MAQWYYAKSGQQLGPVSDADLRQKIASGEVQSSDMVWNEGMANWQAAGTVPELSAGAYPPPPQAYAPPQPGYAPPGGQPLGYGGYAPMGGMAGQDYSGKATASLICGIAGLVVSLLCFIGWIVSIVAIILGIVAKNGMKASGNDKGKGMATAGIVLGIIALALGVGLLIIGLAVRGMR